MNVVRCTEAHREAWDAFVDARGEGSFYHRYGWRSINENCFGHQTAYLAATAGGRIQGILPLVHLQSRIFGRIACSLPFVNFGGLIATAPQIESALIHEARALADEWNVEYLEIRSRHALGGGLPSSQHKVSVTVDLDPDPEKLWAALKTGQRQEIRRAGKHGFETTVGGCELLGDFYEVISESWRDLGTPIYPRSYFEAIARTFADRFRIVVAYAAGEPVAAAFDGFSAKTVEGMWMGAKGTHRRSGVNYVLYWELIRDACVRGFRAFHLGRSTADSGGEAFKKKWNARIEPLHWVYVLRTRQDIPQLNVANSRYRLAIRMWQRMPVPLTQMVGPMFSRSIP